MVNNSRLLHHLSYVVEASNLCATVELFEQSEAPIRGKFGVPYYQGQRYLLVQTTQDPPCKVLHYVAVLVLARTIISMKMEISFPQIVSVEKVM